MLFELEVFFVAHLVGFVATLYGMDLKEWAAVLSIGWVLYQFIDKRRLSEANIDNISLVPETWLNAGNLQADVVIAA
jgi:hypothetical protein